MRTVRLAELKASPSEHICAVGGGERAILRISKPAPGAPPAGVESSAEWPTELDSRTRRQDWHVTTARRAFWGATTSLPPHRTEHRFLL
jgi:hypothetical protein